MRLSETERFPLDEEKIKSRDPEQRYYYFKTLIKKLNDIYSKIANAVNQNEKLRYISQNSKPTPNKGELLVWKDTDAGTGQSTHYLLYNDSGTVISWDSVEKA
jgi:hypothetical protein